MDRVSVAFHRRSHSFAAGLVLLFGCITSLHAQELPVEQVSTTTSADAESAYEPTETSVVDAPPVTSAGRGLFSGSDNWFGFSSPVRIGVSGGENYAEPSEFFFLDVLNPFRNYRFQDGSEEIQYIDGRFAINNDGGGLLNLGLGTRALYASENIIADGNIWYDADTTRDRTFQQFTVGGHVQGPDWLVRSHYYLPFGDTRKVAGYTPLTGNVGYQGNILALERFRRESHAYRGFDAEVGFMVSGEQGLQLLFGYYHFQADDVEDVTGFTTTLVAEVMDSLFIAVQGSFDENEDNNVLVSATYEFNSRDPRRSRSLRDRLGDGARRNRHIVSQETLIYDPRAATDPSGNRINIIHASSAGGSRGTFESPHANLNDAADDADRRPDSIIFVHADSVFDGQSIVLPEATRFLGEGLDHKIDTKQLGIVSLPRATEGTALPIIRNSPLASPALTLADNLEVNGIAIESAMGTGIFGDGLTTGVTLKNTTVSGAGIGMHLVNSAGTLSFDPISIEDTTGAGLLVADSTAAADITFSTVSVTNAGTNGIEISGNADAAAVTFGGPVTVDGAGQHGVAITGNSDGGTLTFSDVTSISGTGGNGILISNVDDNPTAFADDVQFTGAVSISDATGSGIRLNNNGSNVLFGDLSIEDWQTTAIEIDGSSGNFTVTDPLTLDNALGSTDSTILLTGTLGNVTFGDVAITDTVAGTGDPTIALVESNSGVDEVTFDSLTIDSLGRTALGGMETGSNFTKLVINGGEIATDGATAIDLNGQSTDVTFDAVNVTNATVGIRLTNVGVRTAFHDGFRIVGDGSTAGSGGVMTGVDQGVVISGSDDVTLQFMDIDASVTGIAASHLGTTQPQRLTLDELVLSDAAGSAGWVGIDVTWDNGAHFGDNNFITNNTITGNGLNQTGLRITNSESNAEMFVTIEGNSITMTGAGSDGISLSATGISASQTANFGGISLSGTADNTVSATAADFQASESTGATIDGTISVNGVDVP